MVLHRRNTDSLSPCADDTHALPADVGPRFEPLLEHVGQRSAVDIQRMETVKNELGIGGAD